MISANLEVIWAMSVYMGYRVAGPLLALFTLGLFLARALGALA